MTITIGSSSASSKNSSRSSSRAKGSQTSSQHAGSTHHSPTQDHQTISRKITKKPPPVHKEGSSKSHTYIPPHHHETDRSTIHNVSSTSGGDSLSIQNNRRGSSIGMWLTLLGILIIIGLGVIKIYLDTMSHKLDQDMVSEDLVSKSFYISKDLATGGQINYDLISTSQQDQEIAQVTSDQEIQEGQKILSQLKATTGDQLVTQSGNNTGLKTPETLLITDLYRGYNTDDKSLIFPNLDTRFKNSEEYLTYFTTKRMRRFINALDDGLKVNNFKVLPSDNPLYKTMVSYQIQYSLKKKLYLEDWNAYLVPTQDKKFKVKRLYCTTNNCSKGPFFNFQKFDID